uniref:Uncharacterized protein n=1 Tax=Physcomitrium patens TaxID=3218 RepID=A0A7I4B8X1_PHYPA
MREFGAQMQRKAAELGLPLIPPSMDSETKGLKLLQGVNYASAGSGILNSTGLFFLIQLLVWTVSSQLQVLYEFGARKVVVTGLSPLGCCPSQIAKYNLTGECIGFLNDVSKQYNAALMTMLLEKREKLKDFHLVYRNLYDILTEPIASPAMYGFNFSNTACCGVGRLNGKFICTAFFLPCDDPPLHIFFDYYHPTDTMNYLNFRKVYFEGPPYNIPCSAQSLVHVPI